VREKQPHVSAFTIGIGKLRELNVHGALHG
jgi:hypothetical protein